MILIVDDDVGTRELISDILRGAEFNAAEAKSAEQALEMMRKAVYSLVILDLRMPGMGGLGFLQAYQEISPATEVIVLTAYPDHKTAVNALSGRRSAAVGYLEKPLDPRRLVTLVDSLESQIELGPWRIDRIRQIPYYQNKAFQLPPQLLDLFEYFLKYPNERFDYPQLAHMITGQKMDRTEAKGLLKTQMWRLRNTLDEVSGRKDVIDTIAREGFCLAVKPRLE